MFLPCESVMRKLLICLSAWAALASAAEPGPATAPAKETPQQRDKRMAWWREARFGMFINFGLYSIPAGVWNGKDVPGIGEWILHSGRIPLADYEKLAAKFNPTKYSAKEWVALGKQAGMKYLVFDVKHHDGFCLYDSKLTDWDVMDATPFKRDFLKELSQECRKQGMVFCVYYSILDWHNPDYLPRVQWDRRPTAGCDYNRHVDFMKGQLREILTNYGPIGAIWFDGGWGHSAKEHRAEEVVAMMRQLQPGLIINNRINLPQDFDTPEQFIPATGTPGRDWETCMTINDTWGYKVHDLNWKPTGDLLRKLVDIASKGGNFLLNVGPTGEGEIPQPTVERLREMGKWLAANGQSIYGTTASPFRRLTWGRCTKKPGVLYLHVLDWPGDGRLVVPGLANEVKSARLLAGENAALEFRREDANVVIAVQAAAPDPIDTVVVLEIQGEPKVVSAPIRQAKDGTILLRGIDADIHGASPRYESTNGKDQIGYWGDPKDWVSWDLQVDRAGDFEVEVAYSCATGYAGSEYEVVLGARKLSGKTAETGGAQWNQYGILKLGRMKIDGPGRYTLELRPKAKPPWRHIGLKSVLLRAVK